MKRSWFCVQIVAQPLKQVDKDFCPEAASQERIFFHREKVNVTKASRLHSSHTDAVIDLFAAYTAAVTRNAFQWAGKPQKTPTPFGGSGPHLAHGSSGPPKSTLQSASRSVQQTDRHTDRPRYSVCSDRPHPTISAMWPKNLTLNFPLLQ